MFVRHTHHWHYLGSHRFWTWIGAVIAFILAFFWTRPIG